MAKIFTGYYDSSKDDKREYNSYEFSTSFRNIISNGICGLDDLKVEPDTGLKVRLNYGALWINGYVFTIIDDKSGFFTLDIPSSGNVQALYNIIAQLDINNKRLIDPIVKSGAINLIRNEVVYEVLLATITLPPNSGAITKEQIKDYRHDKEYCGFSAPIIHKMGLENLHTHAIATATQAGFESPEHFKRLEELKADKSPTFAGMKLNGALDMNGFPIDNLTFR